MFLYVWGNPKEGHMTTAEENKETEAKKRSVDDDQAWKEWDADRYEWYGSTARDHS